MIPKISIDASGLSCPQPVIETKKILDQNPSGPVEIKVDTVTSRENVARFARSKGWETAFEEHAESYIVTLTRKI